MVARSEKDMAEMLHRGLAQPVADREHRTRFIRHMFGDTLDGGSGKRIAEQLLRLANVQTPS